ncbi:hypothetical protein CDEST_00778 [Colletotrichum destructivum]|uniref:Uncharacterized protein n=1 Tax=Colletotrichum destructivum TaxID=34406 RepID=A0AAX4HXW7_9PEZI|nr:hypothetical protein CDEST_00778 [Colletotrichum destructivum]
MVSNRTAPTPEHSHRILDYYIPDLPYRSVPSPRHPELSPFPSCRQVLLPALLDLRFVSFSWQP